VSTFFSIRQNEVFEHDRAMGYGYENIAHSGDKKFTTGLEKHSTSKKELAVFAKN
jgi:hypothetical protein